MLDRLYAVESARLVAEQENEDLHKQLDHAIVRVCVCATFVSDFK